MKGKSSEWDLQAHIECEAAHLTPAPDGIPDARDTAHSWADITGNTTCVELLKRFVTFRESGYHILIRGHNRSGKTTTINTALKAKFCVKRLPDLSPCNECSNCRRWNSGHVNRRGYYENAEGHQFFYHAIDGTNPATFHEDTVCFYVDYLRPLVLYIDEVAHPEFVKFMPRLLKPMMETPMTIIASGVRLGPRKDSLTGQRLPGLSKDFVYRFIGGIVKTSSPHPDDFLNWLKRSIVRMDVVADDKALPLIIEKAGTIPGQALRPLQKAKLTGEVITVGFVENFDWEV